MNNMSPQPVETVASTSEDIAVREVAGLFPSADALQEAIRELEGTAFPRHDISVMGTRNELVKVFGSETVDPAAVMDNPDTPRQAPSRPEEQNIGTGAMIGVPAYIGAMGLALASGGVAFPAILGAAAIGGVGGGAMGGVLVKLMGDRYDRHLDEQIERGGLLLWVRTPDRERETIAVQIMEHHGAQQVHAQDIK